jgi:hypothetical protein
VNNDQSQLPDKKRLEEITQRWSRKDIPEQLFSAHVKQDVDYLLSLLQQPTTSERCGECGDVDGLVFQFQCAAIQRHVLEPDHNSNWRDCEFSSCAQARATLDRYYNIAATGGEQRWLTCAKCGKRRDMSGAPDDTFVCRYCFSTESAAPPAKVAEGEPQSLCDHSVERLPSGECVVCGITPPKVAASSERCTCDCPLSTHLTTGECPRCHTFCGPVSTVLGASDLAAWAAPTTAPAPPCNHERETGKKVIGCFDCYPPGSTSEAAIQAAREIDSELEIHPPLSKRRLEKIAAVVSKYFDAGEVERLRILRFSDFCNNCGPKFKCRSSLHCAGCGAPMAWSKSEGRLTYSDRKRQVEQLRAELADARANAIREAVEVCDKKSNALRRASLMVKTNDDLRIHELALASVDDVGRALQSLLDKKEGEDGKVESRR